MSHRILVVNDEQSILDLFHLILAPEGYEVIESLIAFEKVNDVEQLHPDLIILDIKLGHHDEGLLFLQKLKMYPPTKDIPIILCTAALNEVREQEDIFRQKGIPVIYKPFNVDELLHVVQQFLPLPSSDEG